MWLLWLRESQVNSHSHRLDHRQPQPRLNAKAPLTVRDARGQSLLHVGCLELVVPHLHLRESTLKLNDISLLGSYTWKFNEPFIIQYDIMI